MDVTEDLATDTLLANRYRIDKILGQGGMGSVYQARDGSLGDKPVAIKEMRIAASDSKSQQQALAQFRQEAQFLAKLDHPNLVQVSDFFAEGGRHYLVMALIKGQSLGDMLQARNAAFPAARVVEWGRQLAQVLTYLHNQNPPILFRDLKPSNIMLDGTGTVRLIDFGIARNFHPEGVTATFLQGMGSAGYSPLEQYQGAGGTDPRSDIYALGATLYHLLTNQVPLSPVELVSENKTMPPPRRWNPTLPTNLDQILLKMLAIRKEDRYQKMEQVQGLLDQLARSLEQAEDVGTQALGGSPSLSPPDSSALANAPTLSVGRGEGKAPMAAEAQSRTMWMTVGALSMVVLVLFGWLGRQGLSSSTPEATQSPVAAATAIVTPAPVAHRELPKPKPRPARPPEKPIKASPPPPKLPQPRPDPVPVVVRQVAAPPIIPSLGDSPRIPTGKRPTPVPRRLTVHRSEPSPDLAPDNPPPTAPRPGPPLENPPPQGNLPGDFRPGHFPQDPRGFPGHVGQPPFGPHLPPLKPSDRVPGY
ncbi:serine/threonine protein kinase [bacterium]|nr:serine/threonine protein kinase [bacterium]